MMNLEYVIKECNRLSAAKGDTFSVPVEINARLRTTLARVTSIKSGKDGSVRPIKMEFSKKIMEVATEDELLKIIRHEWSHYYLDKTSGKDHGHDAVFNALVASIGGQTGTSISISALREEKAKEPKYEVFCSCCGKKVGQYARAGKVVKESDNYTSGCCSSKLIVVQNY